MTRTKQYKKKTPRTNTINRIIPPHLDYEHLYGEPIAGNLEAVAPAIGQEAITAEQINEVMHRYNEINAGMVFQDIGIQATATATATHPDITLDLINDRQ
jgi:hypothetical protein